MPLYSPDEYKKKLNGLTTNPSPNPSPVVTSAPIKNNAPTSLYSPDQFKANLNTLTNPTPLYPSINPTSDLFNKAKSTVSNVINWFGTVTKPKAEIFQSKGKTLKVEGSKYTFTAPGISDPIAINIQNPVASLLYPENQKRITNVLDTIFKLPDTVIGKAQTGLQKFAEVHPVFTDKYLTSAGNALDKSVTPVLNDISQNAPELRGVFKGMNETYLGSSKKVMDVFNTQYDKPTTLLGKARYTGGELAGNVLAYMAGGFVLKGLKLGRAAIPLLYTAIDQSSSPADTTVKQRLMKAPFAFLAGWLLPVTESPTFKALLAQAGETGAIMTSQSFINSMIMGLSKEDAYKAAIKMGIIGAVFHVAAGSTGLLTQSKFMKGQAEMTPTEARNQVIGSDWEKTPAGQDILKASLNADAQGKNLKITNYAAIKSDIAQVFGLKKPYGIKYSIDLVEPTVAGNIGTGEKTQGQAPGSEIQPIKPKIVPASEVPGAAAPVIPQVIPQTIINKYISASDLASAEYSAKPTDQIGKLLSTDIVARDPVDQAVVDEYKNKITSGAVVEPIEIAKTTTGQLETVDGSNRLTAYQQLKQEVPVIYRSTEKITGLSTFNDVYNSSTKVPQEKTVVPQAEKTVVQQPVKIPEKVQTLTGREILTPPGIRIDTNRKAVIDSLKVSKWLVEQAISEAQSKNDEFNLQQFKNIKPENITNAEKTNLNQYLFGKNDLFEQPIENKQLTPQENAKMNKQLNEDIFKALYKGQLEIKDMKAYGDFLMKKIDAGKMTPDQALKVFEERYPAPPKEGEVRKQILDEYRKSVLPEYNTKPEIVKLDAFIDNVRPLDPNDEMDKVRYDHGARFEVSLSYPHSLGEQGNSTDLYFDYKPTTEELKKDIIDEYRDFKEEVNKPLVAGVVAKSGRDENIEKAIDEALKGVKEKKRVDPIKPEVAKTIVGQDPIINLKKEIVVTDVHGKKEILAQGDAFTPHLTSDNKVLLQDGKQILINKNQYENVKGNAVKGEAKPFASELKQTTETVFKGHAVATYEELPGVMQKLVDSLEEQKITQQEFVKKADEIGYTADFDMSGDMTEIYKKGVPAGKYGEYAIPGGTNYREILIKTQGTDQVAQDNFDAFHKELAKKYNINPKQNVGMFVTVKHFTPEEIKKYSDLEKAKELNIASTFKSAHWEDRGVIAHIRLDDRKSPDGGQVTFIEEIQSDWAIEARKQGFIKDTTKETKAFIDYEKYLREKYNFKDISGLSTVITDAENTKWKELNNATRNYGVPTNPLLKNWQELTIKRALLDAVNNGSEYLSWTTGEQQQARYNLSHEIETIQWELPYQMDLKEINIVTKKGKGISVNVDKNGIIKSGGGLMPQDWVGKKVSDAIGKGIGEKIMASEKGTLSGEGLNVGGEWAINLYDKQIKNIVEKLTGGKVEVKDLKLPLDNKKTTWYTTEKSGDYRGGSVTKGELTIENIKKDELIKNSLGDYYIITQVLENGKFEAVPQKDFKKDYWESSTFDISSPTMSKGQQVIKITPEVRAIVSGKPIPLKQPSGVIPEYKSKTLQIIPPVPVEPVFYKRGDITKTEKQLDDLIGTDSFNYNGLWQNKGAARGTAMDQLEYYSKEGIIGAQESYKEALQLTNRLKQLREEKSNIKVPGGMAAAGSESIGNFEKVPINKTENKNFKLFEKIRELTDKYIKMIGKGTLGEGYMSRRAAGLFYTDTYNIRVNGMNNLSVAAHEDSHLLDTAYKISDKLLETTGVTKSGKPIYAKETKGIRKEITALYEEYYPGGKKTHSLKKRSVEGFATLMQKYTEIPTTITLKYPSLVKEFLVEGGKYYKPVIGEMLKDLKDIVKEYQGLDPLDKIGARVTSKAIEPNKEFLNPWEKIKTFVIDEIYPVEKVAKKAGVHFTKEDPSLWLRQIQTGGGVYANNILSNKGYWAFKNGDFVKTHDFNWKTLIDNLNKNKIHDSYGFYLVSRREYFAYQELLQLDKTYQEKKGIVDLMGGVDTASQMVNGEGKSAVDDMKAAKEEYDHLKEILAKDGFTEEEVTEAYLANKDRFSEQDKMFDLLTAEDLKLFNDPQIQLMTPENYQKLADKKGYASFKRQFEDELVGEQSYSGGGGKGGVKASFLKSRTGSARAIIDPVSSGMRNHVEAVKKAMKQIIYNKMGQIASDAVIPDMFQKLQLQPSVDGRGRITYPQEKDPNIIMARVGYKRVPILTHSLIKQTIDNTLTFQAMNIFEHILVSSSRTFTVGTTGLYPAFAATNFAADQWNAIVNSRNKYTPLVDQLKIFKEAIINKTGEVGRIYEMYEILGGSRMTLANFLSLPADEAVKQVINERNGLQKTMDLIDRGVNLMAIPSNLSETTTRFAEFYKAIKAGKPQIVALEEAARVTGPFHHIGSWRVKGATGRNFIRAMPFANAGLQILAQVIETAESSKGGRNRVLFTMLALLGLYLTSMASISLFGSKDQKEQYKDLKPSELGMFLYFPMMNDKGMVRIKVSPELAVLGTLATMALNQRILGNKYTIGNYSDAIFNILPQAMQINDPQAMFLNWFSPIVKIPFELIAGIKDYPHVMPIESKGMEYKPPGQRFNEGTSTLAKKIGEYTNLSPMKIDFLMTGLLGRATGFATGKPGIYSIQSAFLRDYWFTTGRRIENYYNQKTVIDQKFQQIETLSRPERSVIAKQEGQYNRVNELMKEYRKYDLSKMQDIRKAKVLRDKILIEIDKLGIK